MKITFKVDRINAGPAPFDVDSVTGDGTELRLRFAEHPGLAIGDEVTIEFAQEHFPPIVEDEEDEG